jgi:hypothetical protein
MRLRAAAITTVLALALPAAALGAGKTAPPGNSGIDEYVESVTGAGGNVTFIGKGHKSRKLNRKTSRQLQSRGRDGRALQTFVAQTAPPAPPGGSARGKQRRGSTGQKPGSSSTTPSKHAVGSGHSGSRTVNTHPDRVRVLPTVARATTGDGAGGGLGALLPILMAMTVVVAALGRIRRRGPDS